MWFILLSQFTSYTVYFTLSVNYKVSERQQRTTTANALYLLSCKSVCDKELTPPLFFPVSPFLNIFSVLRFIQKFNLLALFTQMLAHIRLSYNLIFNRQCMWIIRVAVRHMQVVVITSYFIDVDKKCVKFM